jgi:predicted naringenin-chalcone synthase
VLRKYGNMSSVSILFVLAEILERQIEAGEEKVCAVAFGPGLTVEMALLAAVRTPSGDPTARASESSSAVPV